MARVLVIDDDAPTLLMYKSVLRTAGHQVTTAALGEDGATAALREQFDVVLCDHRLPDQAGVALVHQICRECPRTAVVLMTGWGTQELAIQAKRAGAAAYVEKPLVGEDLLDVVANALRIQTSRPAAGQDSIGHAARRWADVIVRSLHLVEDPKTVADWCHSIGVARTTMKNRCAAVDTTPKNSLDILRLLRVVVEHAGERWDLQSWLNIVDHRTVHALMVRAGVGVDCTYVPTVESFLSRQLIVRRPEALNALRDRLVHRS